MWGMHVEPDLLESLHSAALNELVIRLLDPPVDLAVQLACLRHSKVVLLAIKVIKQWVQPSCNIPATLQIRDSQTSSADLG